jgi:hypothetical protein
MIPNRGSPNNEADRDGRERMLMYDEKKSGYTYLPVDGGII